MTLIRTIFFALAFTLPVTWTVAMANDEAPAGEKTEKTTKKKKSKKGDGSKETKTETKTEKSAEWSTYRLAGHSASRSSRGPGERRWRRAPLFQSCLVFASAAAIVFASASAGPTPQ